MCCTLPTRSGATARPSRHGLGPRHFVARTATPVAIAASISAIPNSKASTSSRRSSQAITDREGIRCASTARSAWSPAPARVSVAPPRSAFAQHGGKVVVSDVNGNSAEEVTGEITASGGTATGGRGGHGQPRRYRRDGGPHSADIRSTGRAAQQRIWCAGGAAREAPGARRGHGSGGMGLHDPGRPDRCDAGNPRSTADHAQAGRRRHRQHGVDLRDCSPTLASRRTT